MITTPEDYAKLLYRIQDPNRQNIIIRLPKEEQIYYVDLNTRIIQQPKEIVHLEFDHNAETIFFAVDRYFDNVDLSTLTCVIQYHNANPNKKESGFLYAVPYFDITTLKDEGKILFQWAIEGPVTAYTGTVSFSIRFYRISTIQVENENGHLEDKLICDYNLNTLPSTLKVQKGMDVIKESGNYVYDDQTIASIFQAINLISQAQELKWLIMDDTFDPDAPIIFDHHDYPEGTLDRSDDVLNNII